MIIHLLKNTELTITFKKKLKIQLFLGKHIFKKSLLKTINFFYILKYSQLVHSIPLDPGSKTPFVSLTVYIRGPKNYKLHPLVFLLWTAERLLR